MKNIRRILVAIKDTDARTSPAIEKASQLAHAYGASVELFHAVSEPVDFNLLNKAASLDELRARSRDLHLGRLQTAASRLCETGLTATACVDWDYPVYETILRRARAARIDLIVAECHQGSSLVGLMLHLTDWELLRLSPVPVLLVRTPEPYQAPIILAAVDPGHAHAKPAKLDELILKRATSFARALTGSLHVMHALRPMPLDLLPSDILGRADTDVRYSRAQARTRATFERSATRLRIPRARRHLVDGDAGVAIPRTARTIGADIVVMGAVSRSGLRGVFIGNTAERTLRALKCDVLVVKPRGFKARVPRRPRAMLPLPTRSHANTGRQV